MPEGLEAPGRPDGRCVGHRIQIDAPRELVWDFISDFEGWQAWNPLYKNTSGRAAPGAKLHFQIMLEGLKPQATKAQVCSFEPNTLFEYRVSSLGGLVRAFRFIELEELSPTRCRITNGEILGGAFGGLVSRAVGEKVGRGLENMNGALKVVVERKWQAGKY